MPAEFYKKNKERLHKKARERYQDLSQEEKKQCQDVHGQYKDLNKMKN